MSKIVGPSLKTGQFKSILRGYSPYLFSATAVLLVLTTGVTSCEREEIFVGDNVCLSCHDGRVAQDATGFKENFHGNLDLSCEDCHGAGFLHVRNAGRFGAHIVNPGDFGFTESYEAVCAECHQATITQYEESEHFTQMAANCFDCHDIHKDPPFTSSVDDNDLCLKCHVAFKDESLLELHVGPFHTVDLEGTGQGRCATCHMPPRSFILQEFGRHGHDMMPRPPAATIEEIEETGMAQRPNSCAGIMGCHDPGVPGSGPAWDIENIRLLEALQNAYSNVGRLQ